MRLVVIILGMALLATSHPAAAQQIDFGDDSSQYANDGECDDKRFEGPGMTATILLDSDVGADASDCRIAYEAGRLTLRGAAPATGTAPATTAADGIDFGDDSGDYANDGECDDKRFEGPGMTATILLDADIRHDATDCRTAFEAGQLSLRAVVADGASVVVDGIDFGDDSSDYANDGECDDKRFEGPGMTDTTLLDSDVGADASDCRIAYEAGRLTLRDAAGTPTATGTQAVGDVDFGDDSSSYANDGECDDKRFEGPGMTTTILLDSDIRADATDCRTAFEAGTITLRGGDTGQAAADTPQIVDGIDFGNDSSNYANDGECDDKRFEGPGMTATTLLDADVGADATDCRTAYEAGRLTLRADSGPPDVTTMDDTPQIVDGIDFGDDSSNYANDGECDDKRFEGPGMTTTTLLDADVRHDATDCRTAYESGAIWPSDGADGSGGRDDGPARAPTASRL